MTLRFTNLKTKAMTDLTVTGKWEVPSCHDSEDGITGVSAACQGGAVVFNANLPETELRKLPYGGVWVALMRLKTMEWKDKPIGEVVTD
ncbi:CfaE/CblD family pilus tip adhesin, partial [Yersinia enterocolitica]